MSNRTMGLAVASLVSSSFIMLGAASASAADHVDTALQFISTAVVNDWGTPCSIDWVAHSGKTKAACFFTLALKQAKSYHDLDLYLMWGTSGPTSGDIFDLIASSPVLGGSAPPIETFFRKVTSVTLLQKGDIISIGAVGTYSGHTMMVTGPAEEIVPAIQPRYAGTKQWAVPIADSTNTSHGCNASYPDSRWQGPCAGGTMNDGAGTAYIRLYTDALTGISLGYTWSVTSSTTSYYSPSNRPWNAGRLFKLPAPEPFGDPPPPP